MADIDLKDPLSGGVITVDESVVALFENHGYQRVKKATTRRGKGDDTAADAG
ncbi:hypothetical protein [Rhodococcus rhodnii]|uniref:Uncharacterized protein n=1 Tax=Rhodococcus rhodnii LMG 5362 TaxID=1273125 RepID=R7WRU7_9NOCA|nr:hypothetical protein [Rhodococcus rhodnii]EOM78062.1 hypothetical protein Rrhod_0603 [Rhodococcus rhodnii LMG 5362]